MSERPTPKRDPIEYLLNAMEEAGQHESPYQHGYHDKRFAVLAAIKTLRSQRDELAEALRETTKKLSEIAADFNMTRMIMNDDEARKLAGEIVTEARARCNQSSALLARLDAEKSA